MGKIIFFQYFIWHFFDVPKEIIKAWKNYLLFNLNYFSVSTLLKTYFSHWHKYYFSYGKKWDFARYAEAFVGNMMSRFVGIILRTFLIIFGAIAEVIVFFIGALLFLGWIMLPFFLLFIFIAGLGLLI